MPVEALCFASCVMQAASQADDIEQIAVATIVNTIEVHILNFLYTIQAKISKQYQYWTLLMQSAVHSAIDAMLPNTNAARRIT